MMRSLRTLNEGATGVVLRRLLSAIPLLFLVSALSFCLEALAPSDAAREILGPHGTAASYRRLKHSLGLDEPLYQQYWHWLSHAFHGDLGGSLFTLEPVTHAIDARLPVTLSLIAGTLVVTVTVGVALGVLSAVRGGSSSRFVDAFALTGFAIPPFWIGALLIGLLSVDLRWLPATGYVPLTQSATGWLRSLVLPVAALSLVSLAVIVKQTRDGMLEALSSEYIRMARASGISSFSIIFRHALRNAAISITTITGLQAIGLVGGTVFVEALFALPGLGAQAVQASTQHDLPLIEGIAVYFTIMVIVINLITDLVCIMLNPRLRT